MAALAWLLVVAVAAGCVLTGDATHGSAVCAVADCLSTVYARRTALHHACDLSSPRACLTLLLIDKHLEGGVKDGPPAPAASEFSSIKDHADLGFLPRVSRQTFDRLFAKVVAEALPVEGRPNDLVLMPCLALDDGRSWRVTFNAGRDAFVARPATAQT